MFTSKVGIFHSGLTTSFTPKGSCLQLLNIDYQFYSLSFDLLQSGKDIILILHPSFPLILLLHHNFWLNR